MSAPSSLSPRGRTYVYGVIVAGMFAVGASFAEMLRETRQLRVVHSGGPDTNQWFRDGQASFGSRFALDFRDLRLHIGPALRSSRWAPNVALDGLIISLWLARRRKELHRVLFNMAAPALSIWVASQVFVLAGLRPLSQHEASIQVFLAPLLIFTVLYFVLNSWLIAFAVALETGASPLLVWRNNFLWLSLNYFCGASVAALLTVYTRERPMYLGASFRSCLCSTSRSRVRWRESRTRIDI